MVAAAMAAVASEAATAQIELDINQLLTEPYTGKEKPHPS